MLHIIAGTKGKGKTCHIVEMANNAVNTADGNIIFLDNGSRLIYQLDSMIRLINTSNYPIHNFDAFIGFVSGIAAGNHDIECIFFDNFIELSTLTGNDLTEYLDMMYKISVKFSILFILSISTEEYEIPEKYEKNIIMTV